MAWHPRLSRPIKQRYSRCGSSASGNVSEHGSQWHVSCASCAELAPHCAAGSRCSTESASADYLPRRCARPNVLLPLMECCEVNNSVKLRGPSYLPCHPFSISRAVRAVDSFRTGILIDGPELGSMPSRRVGICFIHPSDPKCFSERNWRFNRARVFDSRLVGVWPTNFLFSDISC